MKKESPRLEDNPRFVAIMDFLYGESPAIQGTHLSHDEAIEEALRRNPAKPYCLVKDWILVELDISDEARSVTEVDGFKSFFIHAHQVIEDSASRFNPGNWVRTSLQLKYEGDGFFETRSTVYVLLGDGRHKKLKPEIAYSIRN